MAKTRKLPAPRKYRGRWRAQVTLANGKRTARDFDTSDEAQDWIDELLTDGNTKHDPELGGPTVATVAQALELYAGLYSINKGGLEAELNRINHYLVGAGMMPLRKTLDATGQPKLVKADPPRIPKGWQEHADARRSLRKGTYKLIATLGRTRCGALKTVELRRLMSTMEQEGLSASTIQKEIALLRHMFNVAAKEWAWKGFKNPAEGLKLGKSEARFVFITKEQEQSLWTAISECDNPYFWPLVVCALETTMRKSSLLAMTWEKTDLDGRVTQVSSKTGTVNIPLSRHVVSVLRDMPRHDSGRIFPMSSNAVDMAWDGVRQKAGLPTLQFRDIRHLGATAYARRGFNAHQLRSVLGHKTLQMAQVYVNLVQQDILDAMDATAPTVPEIQVPPPSTMSAEDMLNDNRSKRLARAAKGRLGKPDVPLAPHPAGVETAPMPTALSLESDDFTQAATVAVTDPLTALRSAVEGPVASVGSGATTSHVTDSDEEATSAVVIDFASRRRRTA